MVKSRRGKEHDTYYNFFRIVINLTVTSWAHSVDSTGVGGPPFFGAFGAARGEPIRVLLGGGCWLEMTSVVGSWAFPKVARRHPGRVPGHTSAKSGDLGGGCGT